MTSIHEGVQLLTVERDQNNCLGDHLLETELIAWDGSSIVTLASECQRDLREKSGKFIELDIWNPQFIAYPATNSDRLERLLVLDDFRDALSGKPRRF